MTCSLVNYGVCSEVRAPQNPVASLAMARRKLNSIAEVFELPVCTALLTCQAWIQTQVKNLKGCCMHVRSF